MARFLCAWEFGGGLGHLRRLMLIAAELRAAGHESSFASRDPTVMAAVARAGHEVFAAPRLPLARHLNPAPLNFSDILLNQGFGDVAALRGALRAWRTLIDLVKPDALIADYAPTALLAARFQALPAIGVGSGFSLPLLDAPLPALRPWMPVDVARLNQLDARIVSTIREASDTPSAAPGQARDIFTTHAQVLCTYPQLDPFGSRDAGDYVGPMGDNPGGTEIEWSPRAGLRIFAYLQPGESRFNAVLSALREIEGEAIVAAPGLAADAARELNSSRMRVVTSAVRLDGFLAQADLCVCHGSAGVSARALQAGVPLAMLPLHLEQHLIGLRIQEAGAGEMHSADAPPESVVEWLLSLPARNDMRDAARAEAKDLEAFPVRNAAAHVAARAMQAART